MDTLTITNEALTKFGVTSVLVSILVWLLMKLFTKFFKDDTDKSNMLTTEREELRKMVNDLRIELTELNAFIRTDFRNTINNNTVAYNNICNSNTEMCKAIGTLASKLDRRRSQDDA